MDGRSPESFGNVLRRYRILAGMSQEELAERAGLSVRGIGDLERGQRRGPRLRTVQALADALGLDQVGRRELLAAARPELELHAPVQASDPPPSTPGRLALPMLARMPVPSGSLIGRDADIETIAALLRGNHRRLVTLTGPGGVGKTQLAVAVARRVAGDFADGVAYVDLAPTRHPGMVGIQIARTLGLDDVGANRIIDMLREFLDERRLLLLLDNCEHLLPAMPIAASLLATSPNLRVLATSRERLHLRDEREFAVDPLALPEYRSRTGQPLPPAELLGTAAIQLFVERAQEVDPRFVLTEENVSVVASICERLDGLPLAIELVAARLRHLSVAAVRTRLEQHLPLHEDGPRDLPERQRTLSATIGWSYDLLSPAEQALFRRVSVLVGGFNVPAAEAVALATPSGQPGDGAVPAVPRSAVFASLASLMDKNLLVQAIGDDGEARFAMLETIREYAAERLATSGEEEAVRRAHAAHVLDFVERAAPELGGPDQQRWLNRLDLERDNLRGALAWAADRHDVESGLMLARRLARFWHIRGHAAEGRLWLERMLNAAEGIANDERAWPTYYAGLLAWAQGDLAAAKGWFDESLGMFRDLDDRKGIATAVGMLGAVAEHEGELERAVELNQESLALYRELDSTPGIATLLDALGNIAVDQGDHDCATAYFDEALTLYRDLEDAGGIARVLSNIGALAFVRGDMDSAERASREGLVLHSKLGYKEGAAYALENLGRVAAAGRDAEQAARLWGAAEALREEAGTPLPPSAHESLRRDVAAVRQQLHSGVFRAAWEAGRSLSLEKVVTDTLAES
ncbi:MAG TPA: tetratricopeptide repeat protein [Thermomicrobiales bacterium]|nr:tetratricopeptide repeat protein [Thermomicrobiales bacterium]